MLTNTCLQSTIIIDCGENEYLTDFGGRMKYKFFNKLMIVIMSFGSIYLCLYRVFMLNRYKRITTDLAIIIVLMIPYILSRINIKLSEKEKSVFYGYIFVADFLGCVVNLFAKISWFDTFSHFLSGIFFFLVGLKLLKMFKQYNSKNIIFNLLFIFGIVFISAGLWEIIEYSVDLISGSNLQHNKDTGVVDTMEDMIACFVGGVLCLIFYLIGKFKTRKKIK